MGLSKIPGLNLEELPDPTGNPITRIKVSIDPTVSGLGIGELCNALYQGDPAIVVRDHHLDLGFFEIDPCNMKPGDPETVIRRFQELQSLIGNSSQKDKKTDTLGPRRSDYDKKGMPIVDTDKVPWNYHRTADREEELKCWPESFLKQ